MPKKKAGRRWGKKRQLTAGKRHRGSKSEGETEIGRIKKRVEKQPARMVAVLIAGVQPRAARGPRRKKNET